MIEDAATHPWTLGCQTCQREAEARVAELEAEIDGLRDALDSVCVAFEEDVPDAPAFALRTGRAALGNAGSNRVAELEAALRPFVQSTEQWAETNRQGWRDEECGTLDGAGNPVEWFADIEISNRAVLAARLALKGQGADS